MHELTFIELMKISLVMPVLLVLSIVLVMVFLERWIFFTRMARVDASLFKRVKQAVREKKLKEAQQIASGGRGLLAQALEAELDAAQTGSREEIDTVLTLYYQRVQALLSRRLGIFGTLSFISPLLGLLGTVLGVMRAFRDLALSGSGGPTIVAAGISEALIATAAGIAVAVSAALIYNYFNFRLKYVLNSLNLFGQEILLLVVSGKEI
ncbi:MAG TPA: MotA/TolQ/ExbB proton channel family protein [Elusimicrobiota bacterium]|nr:MotA/TolQ/ExbB proton channel family protein [Elusimicrobiota bacterium]